MLFTAAGRPRVTFAVEDDGPGCAHEELEALTRRGFRADESRPGSGLGLAIVRDIVETYGGGLRFGRSAALGGLRVDVTFPWEEAEGKPGWEPSEHAADRTDGEFPVEPFLAQEHHRVRGQGTAR